jgi:glycosyltransferase involved in cell wall biosynthesis
MWIESRDFDSMNWITSQIGAREHYAVPRVLHREGKLERLYTDFWASAPWRLIGKLTGKGSMSSRCHADLLEAPVTGFNFHALKASRQRFTNPYDGFLQVGEAFGRDVVEDLDANASTLAFSLQPSFSSHSCPPPITHHPSPITKIFFGYDTGFLEPARWVKARGGKTIVCQMDPARYEVELVKEEEKRWPGWAKRSVEVPESYYCRREEEWAVADLVMVNSEWSKQALIKQGVSDDKIVVVPLAYEAEKVERENRKEEGAEKVLDFRFDATLPPQSSGAHSHWLGSSFSPKRPLRVLFLGQVILRKGIQYLIEAAMLLRNEAIHFDIVGSIGISDQAVASAPSNMTFHGPVSRDRTDEFYRSADLFVLPTLSDGFALTQLEAMAHGLPVIATPNCGEVVTDGVDGLIVPGSDSNALAEAFQLLIQDPEKLRSMSAATKAKVEQFSLSKLAENLEEVEKKLKMKNGK